MYNLIDMMRSAQKVNGHEEETTSTLWTSTGARLDFQAG
jgi:hypothetical protein